MARNGCGVVSFGAIADRKLIFIKIGYSKCKITFPVAPTQRDGIGGRGGKQKMIVMSEMGRNTDDI